MADATTPPTNAMMSVAASAMRAQQSRMRVIAENLANVDSVSKTAGGDPYRRQVPVFAPVTVDGVQEVKMTRVAQDQSAFRSQYQPGHPSADAKGYVKLPNVDPLVEALDMREAQRAYQANLNVIETAKSMAADTIAILNK
jgi:flagellar basal-body rod protein FlgC